MNSFNHSGTLRLTVQIPANSTATVRIPAASASVAVSAPAQAVAMDSYTFTTPAA